MTKYDWETIKKQYIYGIRQEDGTKRFPTLDELCKHYGCSLGTIGSRAKKGEWKNERKKISDKIEKKVAEKRTEYEAEQIIQDQEEYRRAANLARDVAVKKLRQLNKDMDNPDPKVFVRAYDIKMATEALATSQSVGLTADEEVTGRTKVEVDGKQDLNVNLKVKSVEELFDEAEKGNDNSDG